MRCGITFLLFVMFLFLNFFRVSYTCSGCFELFCMSSTGSENQPVTSRYFDTYKNIALIFNHNHLPILGIERSKIKAGINNNFSLSGKTVVESNEGSDRAPVMSTPIQSTSSAFKHGCTKSRSIKKVEDALPKIPHKRKEVLL